MGDWLLNMLDWKIHGPLGAAVVGIIYFGRKHLSYDNHRFEKSDDRVRALEVDRITKSDMTRVEDKIDDVLKILASRNV